MHHQQREKRRKALNGYHGDHVPDLFRTEMTKRASGDKHKAAQDESTSNEEQHGEAAVPHAQRRTTCWTILWRSVDTMPTREPKPGLPARPQASSASTYQPEQPGSDRRVYVGDARRHLLEQTHEGGGETEQRGVADEERLEAGECIFPDRGRVMPNPVKQLLQPEPALVGEASVAASADDQKTGRPVRTRRE